MKKKSHILLVLFLVGSLVYFSSCNDDPICTSIFSMSAVQISGLQPDYHFTVRQSTGDTVHKNSKLSDSLYLILDDNFHPQLKESSDIFIFHAYFEDSLIAKEEYLIAGDECHIRTISGKRELVITK